MRKYFILILSLVVLGASCTKSIPTDNKLSMQVDELFTSTDNLSQFSGTILIAQKGEIVFEKSYGYKNAEAREKNTNNSIYRIFSITKTFTATVILQLQQEGKLSLDDKLSKFYPNFPKADSITIKNLLGHTSGIRNEVDAEKTIDETTFIKHISNEPLDFAPGTAWNYSNSNYYILGYIIKHVTGQDYEKEITQRILTPLHMQHTGFDFKNLKDVNATIGYEFQSANSFSPAVRFKTDHPFAAGAMYSTAEDLFKFSEALKNNTLLSAATSEQVRVPQQGSTYGLGFELGSIVGNAQVGHTGGGPGYRTGVYRFLDTDITVVVLCNSESSSVDAIADKIFHIVNNKPYSKLLKERIESSKLQKLEGVYKSADAQFSIRIKDGLVIFSEKGYSRLAIVPITDSTFQLKQDLSMLFKKDATGAIDSLIVSFPNGMVKRNKKVDVNLVWGIIGDATTSGWDGKDIVLLSDAGTPNILFLKNVQLKKGGLRFRLDNDWGSSLGLNDDNSLVFSGYNIKVPEAGAYDITLDITNSFAPQYTLSKVN